MLPNEFYCVSRSSQFIAESKAIGQGKGIHAYLLEGAAGMGKKSFASLLACAFLCRESVTPCFTCVTCTRILHQQHPDVHFIEREKTMIKVDQIRELIATAAVTSYEGSKKIYIIEKFHTANEQAQNALLKTLEEPPASVVFLLLTENLLQVLPTVRSRCRTLHLYGYPQEDIAQQLKLLYPSSEKLAAAAEECGGNIGRAIEILQSEEYWEVRKIALQLLEMLEEQPSVPRIAQLLEKHKDSLPELLEFAEELVRKRIRSSEQSGERTIWLERLRIVTDAQVLRKKNVNAGLILEELAYGLVKGGIKWQR